MWLYLWDKGLADTRCSWSRTDEWVGVRNLEAHSHSGLPATRASDCSCSSLGDWILGAHRSGEGVDGRMKGGSWRSWGGSWWWSWDERGGGPGY
jgi:hypothetical protein